MIRVLIASRRLIIAKQPLSKRPSEPIGKVGWTPRPGKARHSENAVSNAVEELGKSRDRTKSHQCSNLAMFKIVLFTFFLVPYIAIRWTLARRDAALQQGLGM